MVRYLLFDSGCSTCSEIARAIEQEVNGQFTVRSLRDSDIQDLLNQANPGWQWQPTLLEVSDDKVRAYSGLPMGIRLVMKLGPRQALRLVKLVHRFSVSPTGMGPADPGRRRFLRRSGSAFAALALLLRWPKSLLFRKDTAELSPQQVSSIQTQQGLDEGELWEGFLLLPEVEGPMPPAVRLVEGIHLHLEDGSDNPLRGETIKLDNVEELRSLVPFPIYTPTELPSDLQFTEAVITRYVSSGDIWNAAITYAKQDEPGALEHRISLIAQPIFAQPYPVWPVHDFHFVPTSEEPREQVIFPEKVTFPPLPPGILLPSAQGHVLLWIEQDVLYSVVAEHDPTRGASVSWAEDTGGGSFECCDSESTPTDLKRAVKVNLYADYDFECYVGWVLFGHVDEEGRNLPNG